MCTTQVYISSRHAFHMHIIVNIHSERLDSELYHVYIYTIKCAFLSPASSPHSSET